MRLEIFKLRILLIIVSIKFINIQSQCLNLVQNHDFKLGNTAFTSAYSPCSTNNCLIPESMYVVGKNANFFHYLFNGSDHTSGSGYYMMVNGSGTPDRVIWSQSINVKPNTDYKFSTWVLSLLTGQLAKLQFQINGVDIGPIFTAPNQTNLWLKYEAPTWNSGTNTTATINVLNQNTSTGGNDFGLDDIAFEEPCPTPIYMIDFNAREVTEHNQVSVWWTINPNQNIKFFELYKAYDNYNFTKIQTIKHNGNQTNKTMDHTSEKSKKVYYKIVCLDDQRKVIYTSKVIKINATSSNIKIYPNPSSQSTINILNTDQNLVLVEVYNLVGQCLKKVTTNKENNILEIDFTDLPNGKYIVKTLNDEGESAFETAVIMR
jgi:hypothetical protein